MAGQMWPLGCINYPHNYDGFRLKDLPEADRWPEFRGDIFRNLIPRGLRQKTGGVGWCFFGR